MPAVSELLRHRTREIVTEAVASGFDLLHEGELGCSRGSTPADGIAPPVQISTRAKPLLLPVMTYRFGPCRTRMELITPRQPSRVPARGPRRAPAPSQFARSYRSRA